MAKERKTLSLDLRLSPATPALAAFALAVFVVWSDFPISRDNCQDLYQPVWSVSLIRLLESPAVVQQKELLDGWCPVKRKIQGPCSETIRI